MSLESSKPDEPTRKPISEKQLAANRANAQKSTGPTSPEGLARSAQNSFRHGFRASKFAILTIEDGQHLENLKADIIQTYQPVNHMELLACERIATTFFSMQRASQFEAGMFTRFVNLALDCEENLDDQLREKALPGSGQGAAFCMAEGFHIQNKRSNDFALFLRYKAQAERDYRRAVEEFERLRNLRDQLAEFPNEPISAADDTSVNEPTSREAAAETETERSEDLPPVPSPQSPAPEPIPNEPNPSREAATFPQSPAPSPQSPASDQQFDLAFPRSIC